MKLCQLSSVILTLAVALAASAQMNFTSSFYGPGYYRIINSGAGGNTYGTILSVIKIEPENPNGTGAFKLDQIELISPQDQHRIHSDAGSVVYFNLIPESDTDAFLPYGLYDIASQGAGTKKITESMMPLVNQMMNMVLSGMTYPLSYIPLNIGPAWDMGEQSKFAPTANGQLYQAYLNLFGLTALFRDNTEPHHVGSFFPNFGFSMDAGDSGNAGIMDAVGGYFGSARNTYNNWYLVPTTEADNYYTPVYNNPTGDGYLNDGTLNWATLCVDFPYYLPAGAKAYIVDGSGIDAKKELDWDFIPAGVPVLLSWPGTATTDVHLRPGLLPASVEASLSGQMNAKLTADNWWLNWNQPAILNKYYEGYNAACAEFGRETVDWTYRLLLDLNASYNNPLRIEESTTKDEVFETIRIYNLIVSTNSEDLFQLFLDDAGFRTYLKNLRGLTDAQISGMMNSHDDIRNLITSTPMEAYFQFFCSDADFRQYIKNLHALTDEEVEEYRDGTWQNFAELITPDSEAFFQHFLEDAGFREFFRNLYNLSNSDVQGLIAFDAQVIPAIENYKGQLAQAMPVLNQMFVTTTRNAYFYLTYNDIFSEANATYRAKEAAYVAASKAMDNSLYWVGTYLDVDQTTDKTGFAQLSIESGKPTFATAIDTWHGNTAYYHPNLKSLQWIAENGTKNGVYIIRDQLLAKHITYVDDEQERWVYAKDDNNFKLKDENSDNFIDYMHNSAYFNEPGVEVPSAYDQSNWVCLHVSQNLLVNNGFNDLNGMADDDPDKQLPHAVFMENVTGKVIDTENLTIEVSSLSTSTRVPTAEEKLVNVYSAPNFYSSTTQYDKYFFAHPKPNEVALLTWAIFDETAGTNGAFVVPQRGFVDGRMFNEAGLKGGYEVDFTICVDNPFTSGTAYTFYGVIAKKNGSPAPRRAPSGDNSNINTELVVRPLYYGQGDPIVTGVEDIRSSAKPEVVRREYVNVSGVRSAMPWKGVNIIVSHHADGSTTTDKVVF